MKTLLNIASVFIFCVTLCDVHARYTDKETEELIRELADILADKLEDIGRRNNLNHKRIIGGSDVHKVWPWLVSMRQRVEEEEQHNLGWFTWTTTKTKDFHFCGASLINDRWLLTAGHCFIPDDKSADRHPLTITDKDILSKFEARLGDKELAASTVEKIKDFLAQAWKYFFGGDELDDWVNWEVDFEKVIVHPDYQGTAAKYWANDIALVKLAEAVPHTPEEVSRIQSVELPEQTDDLSWPDDDVNCVLKGWGCTELGGDTSEEVRMGALPKVPDAICSDVFKTLFKGNIPVTQRVCAGPIPEDEGDLIPYTSLGSSACPGDSGGPLMCPLDDAWVQAGVTSFIVNSPGLANAFPTVFTRVTRYVDWIKETIDNN